MSKIVYHGTNETNAASIRKEGFRVGTYFATKREDAVEFGGPCVFSVKIDPSRLSPDVDWQFHTLEPISAGDIVAYDPHAEAASS